MGTGESDHEWGQARVNIASWDLEVITRDIIQTSQGNHVILKKNCSQNSVHKNETSQRIYVHNCTRGSDHPHARQILFADADGAFVPLSRGL